MINWLLNLQSKPEGYRKRFTIFFSVGFTLVIIAIWFVSMLYKSKDLDSKKVVESAPGPLDSIISSGESAIDSIRSVFNNY
jgi:hypothetical protein